MSREVQQGDSYLDKVKKLIPAEVSAAFLAINASMPLSDTVFYYAVGFFLILIPICALYLRFLENVTDVMQIAFICVIAFPVWALNIAVDRLEFMQDKLFLSSSLLVLVTLFIPLVVKR
jgi:hypothetical protein